MTSRTFERAYLEEFFKLQRQQWENYADGAGHNLSLVEADLQHLLLESRGSLNVRGRKGDIIRAIVSRGLVDLHPEVSSYETGSAIFVTTPVLASRTETGKGAPLPAR